MDHQAYEAALAEMKSISMDMRKLSLKSMKTLVALEQKLTAD